MKLIFLGATHTVTGSKYLLSFNQKKVLIDCGLFQGLKELRLRNWNKLHIDPKQIDAVILTHAHIDHSGYIPLLVKNGFKGPIYCSNATLDLCKILLPDSGHLQQEEANYANKHGYSKHHPALPLYTEDDANYALKQFMPVDYGKDHRLDSNTSFMLHHAGHILGASMVSIRHFNTHTLFTGDLGRPNDAVMRPPAIIQSADYLIAEATYGDRKHESTSPETEIADVVNRTVRRGGTILIPSFAVGRAQAMLYYIYLLKKTERIPDIPVFLDSPMATDATKLLFSYFNEHRLSKELCKQVCQSAHYIRTPEESMALDTYKMPRIIISASGMATGGRVLHHLKVFAPNPRNTILFTGYQANGTRGARIIAGEREVKMHGQMITIHAEVASLNNTSAHVDYQEMLDWLHHFIKPPKKTFLTHGETTSLLALKEKIERELNWSCFIPHYLDTETIE